MPTVGSSNMINSGSANNVIAKDNRRFMPPENCATFLFNACSKFTRTIFFSILSLIHSFSVLTNDRKTLGFHKQLSFGIMHQFAI